MFSLMGVDLVSGARSSSATAFTEASTLSTPLTTYSLLFAVFAFAFSGPARVIAPGRSASEEVGPRTVRACVYANYRAPASRLGGYACARPLQPG